MIRGDAPAILAKLQEFLRFRGWTSTFDGERFNTYRPPPDLGLSPDYKLKIPKQAHSSDAARLLMNVTAVLATIYRQTTEQVEAILVDAGTILSIKVADEETVSGSIGFRRFDEMMRELRNLVSDTTAFVTSDDDPLDDTLPVEALGFLDQCRFLQTEKGSFIASLQLPSSPIIREASLLNPNPIFAAAVPTRLEKVLAFVSNEVLDHDDAIFTDDHIQAHPDLINLNVLEDVRNFLNGAGDTEVSFSFTGIDQASTVKTGRMTDERLDNLTEYVKFVKEHLHSDVPLNVVGKIVELRSRNPAGDRNYVVVKGEVDNRDTFVAVVMDNVVYARAVSAHRENHRVRVVGRARKMKTQMKVTALESFGRA